MNPLLHLMTGCCLHLTSPAAGPPDSLRAAARTYAAYLDQHLHLGTGRRRQVEHLTDQMLRATQPGSAPSQVASAARSRYQRQVAAVLTPRQYYDLLQLDTEPMAGTLPHRRSLRQVNARWRRPAARLLAAADAAAR